MGAGQVLTHVAGPVTLAIALVAALAPVPAAAQAAATPPGTAITPVSDPWYAAGRDAAAERAERAPRTGTARNVVLFLGDGMGLSTVTAARILEGQRRGAPGEEGALAFESLPVTGLVRVFNTDQQVPDSAGTMTAIMSGVKTRAGVLGVASGVVPGDHTTVADHHVPTLLELAEDRGLQTGIVTTARITHATPAACYAHAPSRVWENDAALSDAARRDDFPDLARQLVEFAHGDGIDVILGGGRESFLGANQNDPEGGGRTGARWDERDLTEFWRNAGPGRAVAWTAGQMLAQDAPGTRQIMGLFEPGHMKFEADRGTDTGGEPSLSQMTEFALRRLSRASEGYVLVVEGGRIDHGHHANNAYRALDETIEFAKAVGIARQKTDPADTLIVVTADHGHPFTLSGYATRGNPILGLVHENAFDHGSAPIPAPVLDGAGVPYATLGYAVGPGHHAPTDQQPEGNKRFPHEPTKIEPPSSGRPSLTRDEAEQVDHLQQSTVPRYSGVHSGEDVAVWAGGPGEQLFSGSLDQSVLFHGMVRALGWVGDPEPPVTPAPAPDATPDAMDLAPIAPPE